MRFVCVGVICPYQPRRFSLHLCRIEAHFLEDAVIDPKDLVFLLARAASDKKADDPVILRLEGRTSYCDYFFICSAASNRQVQAIADHLEREAREQGVRALSSEGQESGKWVLLDFGSVVAHIFLAPVREFYDLEGLWIDARRVPVLTAADDPTRTVAQ